MISARKVKDICGRAQELLLVDGPFEGFLLKIAILMFAVVFRFVLYLAARWMDLRFRSITSKSFRTWSSRLSDRFEYRMFRFPTIFIAHFG